MKVAKTVKYTTVIVYYGPLYSVFWTRHKRFTQIRYNTELHTVSDFGAVGPPEGVQDPYEKYLKCSDPIFYIGKVLHIGNRYSFIESPCANHNKEANQ